MRRRLSDWISLAPIFKILSIFVAFTVFGFFPVLLASLFFKMVDYTCRLKRGFNRLLVLGSLAITIIATIIVAIIVTIIVTPSSPPSPGDGLPHRHGHVAVLGLRDLPPLLPHLPPDQACHISAHHCEDPHWIKEIGYIMQNYALLFSFSCPLVLFPWPTPSRSP